MRRTFEVVELSGAHRPPECGADREDERHRQRNEQEQDVHYAALDSIEEHRETPWTEIRDDVRFAFRARARRIALATTSIEEIDIPNAAASGVRWPVAASGIATTL